MPSPFPRLSVVITPEQYQLLKSLAKLQGRSASSYLRHLLDLATPRLTAILGPLQQAQREEDDLNEADLLEMQDDLAEADRQSQLDFEDLDDAQMLPTVDAGGAATDRSDSEDRTASPSSAGPAAPPYSNTGVRNPSPGVSNVSILRARSR